jgi:hypothetical protein
MASKVSTKVNLSPICADQQVMRLSRGMALSIALILSLTLIGFQNCGPAFKSAGRAGSSELGSGLSTGSILKLTPFDGGDPDTEELSVDFSSRVQKVGIANLIMNQEFLGNGKFKIDRDSAFPLKIASPRDSLQYPVNDSRFRQVNTYFHLNNIVKSLVNNGVFPTEFNLLTADANCVDDDGGKQTYLNNAYYDPSRDLLCMGVAEVGSFKAWSANDADVVVHEFGHAINHQVSSSEILGSTLDLGALDEGLADVWAYSQNSNPHIAKWYGAAIYEASGSRTRPFTGLRDLGSVPNFPLDRTGQKHQDSRVVSTVFRGLSQRGVSKDTLQKLGIRVLENMQILSTFAEIMKSVKSEGAALGISPAIIDDVLNERKLLRKDDANQLSLVASKPVFVIDAHDYPGYQEMGNCDGELDAGESAILYMNLTNTGPAMGTVVARLTSSVPAAQIQILAGAQDGTYTHFPADTSYRAATLGRPGTQSYILSLLYSAFAVKVGADTPAGDYEFTLELVAMNSIDGSSLKKSIPFALTVGRDANVAGKCAGNLEQSVYP